MRSFKVTVALTGALSIVVNSTDEHEAEQGAMEALWAVLDAAGVSYDVEWVETDGVSEIAPASLIGKRCRFNYANFGSPDGFPEYTAHRGATVVVLRQLTDEECDPECQPMFEVRAEDGWTGTADASELAEV